MPNLVLSSWYGRLGNNLLQLATALCYAEQRRVRVRITAPRRGLLATLPAEFDLADGAPSPEVAGHFYPFSGTPDIIEKTLGRYGVPPLDADAVWVVAARHLGPTLWSALPRRPALDSSTLVIHMRSGDVFSSRAPNPHYQQPPLCFYKAVIEEGGFARVIIVTESDRSNPCIAALQAWRPHVEVRSGALADDVALCLAARHLVSSAGSFVYSLLMACHELAAVEQLYVCVLPTPNSPWIYLPSDCARPTIRRYAAPRYASAWHNTAAERAAMLQYAGVILMD